MLLLGCGFGVWVLVVLCFYDLLVKSWLGVVVRVGLCCFV